MKIRNGFVSNSSSSSFVVGFKSLPQNEDEMREMLFGDGEAFDGLSAAEAARIVFGDFADQLPMTVNEIVEEVASGWVDGITHTDMPSHLQSGQYQAWFEEEDKRIHAQAVDMVKALLESNKGVAFFKFHFGDESGGAFGILEHGGTFDRLPSITISHH